MGEHISRAGLIYRTQAAHTIPNSVIGLSLLDRPERCPISAMLSLTLWPILSAYFALRRPSWLDDIVDSVTCQFFYLVAYVAYSLNLGQVFVEVFTQKGPATYVIGVTKQKPLAGMKLILS